MLDIVRSQTLTNWSKHHQIGHDFASIVASSQSPPSSGVDLQSHALVRRHARALGVGICASCLHVPYRLLSSGFVFSSSACLMSANPRWSISLSSRLHLTRRRCIRGPRLLHLGLNTLQTGRISDSCLRHIQFTLHAVTAVFGRSPP